MNAWYKSVPAHWGRARVKSVARRITDGAHISPDTEQGIYDFVSTRDVKAGKINYAGSLKTSSATYEYMVKTGCRPNLGMSSSQRTVRSVRQRSSWNRESSPWRRRL